VAEYLVEWEKEYRAVLRLGETTDTQDATGKVLTRRDSIDVDEAAIRAAVATFIGPQQQVPPMFSAVKIGGRPLYKAARAGETVSRRERSIVIHTLDVLAIDDRDVTLSVVCSKGTYIRTLCADIGDVLGVGGHLHELERRRVGPLSIDQALTIDQVAARAAVGVLRQHLISIDHVLDHLPAVVVPHELIPRVLHGGPVAPVGAGKMPFSSGSVSVRLKDESGRLLAIGIYEGTESPIKIDKVLTGRLNDSEEE
jgi:tRNA pseudouridine55 synthase